MSAPITIVQCLTAAATAVENDTGVAWFLSTNYPGSTLQTFIGQDGSNPPTELQAPFVVFLPSLRPYDLGEGTDERAPTFEVEFGLLDERVSTSGARKTYTGLVNIDAFGNAILAAIKTAFVPEHIRVANYSLDESTRFPLFQGGMSITAWWVIGLDETVAIGDQ